EGSQPGHGAGHGAGGHRSTGPCPENEHNPSDCGSGGGGARREWELPDLGNDDDGSVDEGRGQMVREQTARAIVAHAKARGDVPAGMLRAADEILNPTIDWRAQLSTVARRAIANQAGRRDYSYSRPSRRASNGVVLPAMRKPPPPNVSIVIDTSGSVSDRMLGQALSEVKEIIERAVGHAKPVRVINCDAKGTLPVSVRNIRNFQLVGGGGTDMRVGMEDAANDRPRPDLVLVFTDGYTPWPNEPPAGAPFAKYAAVLLDDASVRNVPDWMAKIVIETLD
ncbi:vWA domain-containing protein, partial [Tessaracoccus sp.]